MGVCCKMGKNFGKLIDHFIFGGVETCMMANVDGSLKIIGKVGKINHEKKLVDFRGSPTMYWSGNAAGNNGPMVFAKKGKNKNNNFSDKFIKINCCTHGSTIVMTENAFMTD